MPGQGQPVQVAHQEAADAHLRPHVQEDAHRAQHQGRVPPGPVPGVGRPGSGAGLRARGGPEVRLAGRPALGKPEQGREQGQARQHRRQDEVGQPHRRRLGGARAPGQDQGGAEQGRQGGAQGVEPLGEGQAAGGGFRPAQDGHVRIGRHLQEGHARRQKEQGQEEHGVAAGVRGGEEEQASAGHGAQPADHAPLVAQAIDQPPGRKGDQEISREKAQLDEHGLGVVQAEDALEVGHQDVVQTGDEAEDEIE